jgi:nanoRNase/pAp phosphatase (c-di-AMP/oligoRNAs hydrolase)
MSNIIIHHNDNDGRLAAVLMAQDIRDNQHEASEFIEADYRSEIDLSRFAGQTLLKHQAQTNADRLANIGWTSTFENRRCLCCDGILGSDAFGLDAFVKHPILVAYSHDGEQFSVSLYSAPTSGIDVGEIARQRGGGGHPNAAGFRCKTLPMIKEAAYVAR